MIGVPPWRNKKRPEALASPALVESDSGKQYNDINLLLNEFPYQNDPLEAINLLCDLFSSAQCWGNKPEMMRIYAGTTKYRGPLLCFDLMGIGLSAPHLKRFLSVVGPSPSYIRGQHMTSLSKKYPWISRKQRPLNLRCLPHNDRSCGESTDSSNQSESSSDSSSDNEARPNISPRKGYRSTVEEQPPPVEFTGEVEHKDVPPVFNSTQNQWGSLSKETPLGMASLLPAVAKCCLIISAKKNYGGYSITAMLLSDKYLSIPGYQDNYLCDRIPSVTWRLGLFPSSLEAWLQATPPSPLELNMLQKICAEGPLDWPSLCKTLAKIDNDISRKESRSKTDNVDLYDGGVTDKATTVIFRHVHPHILSAVTNNCEMLRVSMDPQSHAASLWRNISRSSQDTNDENKQENRYDRFKHKPAKEEIIREFDSYFYPIMLSNMTEVYHYVHSPLEANPLWPFVKGKLMDSLDFIPSRLVLTRPLRTFPIHLHNCNLMSLGVNHPQVTKLTAASQQYMRTLDGLVTTLHSVYGRGYVSDMCERRDRSWVMMGLSKEKGKKGIMFLYNGKYIFKKAPPVHLPFSQYLFGYVSLPQKYQCNSLMGVDIQDTVPLTLFTQLYVNKVLKMATQYLMKLYSNNSFQEWNKISTRIALLNALTTGENENIQIVSAVEDRNYLETKRKAEADENLKRELIARATNEGKRPRR